MKQLFSRPMCSAFFLLAWCIVEEAADEPRSAFPPFCLRYSNEAENKTSWPNQRTFFEPFSFSIRRAADASLCRGSIIQTSTFTGLISDDRWTFKVRHEPLTFWGRSYMKSLCEGQTGDRIRPSASSSSLRHMPVDAGGDQVIVPLCCLTPAGSYLLPEISSNTCVFVALCNVKQRRMKSWTLAALRLCPNLVNKHWEAIL